MVVPITEGDDASGAIEDVAFLARTGVRGRLLEALADRGRCRRGELQERIDVDRTTITRNLDDLEERGWITRSGRSYELTTAGEAVLADFGTLVETVRTTNRLRPFLAWFPDDAVDLDLRHLRDATLTVATDADPYASINRHVDTLASASEARLLVPVANRGALESCLDRLETHDLDVEVVVASGPAEVLRSAPAYAPSFEAARECGLDAFVYDGALPFHLGIYEDCVQIGVEDDAGAPRALVESRDDAVREWAEATYASYRGAARRLG